MKIGIGITTHNRPKVLKENYQKWLDFLPDNAEIVVVDDNSSQSLNEITTYYFKENVGIAQAKNKCIELLTDLGCDEIFLADDDIYPISKNWWKPYVESKEPHLMYLFKDLAGKRKLNDIKQIYKDKELVAYTHPRGCLLYINKTVVDKVGGMDKIYGKWGYEHVDYSNRIYNAGLTSFRFADVIDSHLLFHSMDEYEEVIRTVAPMERQRLAKQNAVICNQRRETGYKEYCEYRQVKNAIITCLYGVETDPQRVNSHMSLSMVDKLKNSVKRAELVCFTDLHYNSKEQQITYIHSDKIINVFWQRHLNAYQYLRDNPNIEYAFCVDATDVIQQVDFWDNIQKDKLYIGYEPTIVNNQWLKEKHKSNKSQQFIEQNSGLTLLNAGVFGGHRDIVLSFLHDLIEYWHDLQMDIWHKKDSGLLEFSDMAGLNAVAYTKYADKLVFGPQITTLFKKEEKNNFSWFKHK